jgi:hypothetical protein
MSTKFISRVEEFLLLAAREIHRHRLAELRRRCDEWIRRLSGVGKGAER